MNIYSTDLNGVLVLEPDRHTDERGEFIETFNHEFYNKIIPDWLNNFVQDNLSVSKKGVFRGLHYQTWPMQQSKLIQVVKGRIFDIIVCIIKNSPDYGKYIGVEISDKDRKQIYIPRGFAHGFIALEDDTVVTYKVDQYWSPRHEKCISANAIDLSVFNIDELKDMQFIISEKDKAGVNFEDLKDEELFFESKPNEDNNNVETQTEPEELPESTSIIETE